MMGPYQGKGSCAVCPNAVDNETLTFFQDDKTKVIYCSVCAAYRRDIDRGSVFAELTKIQGKRAMVGMSGGKDSTATAYAAKQYFKDLTAFTFETGYYPPENIVRARRYSHFMGISHETIDIRPYITPKLRDSYRETAKFFDNPSMSYDNYHYKDTYKKNRKHYSAKDQTVMPFVRPCILCRKVVIQAYYAEAVKRGVEVVVLGMNEWTHLSTTGTYTGIRKLQPFEDKPPVYVAHLPFILGWNLDMTLQTSMALSWLPPEKDKVISTNSNSCLLAKTTEYKARIYLGFHPDTTRLAREVTSGFLTKVQAQEALSEPSSRSGSVLKLLQEADIL